MKLKEIIDFIVDTIGGLGYFGIFVMMFLESSFFPFPSEIVMIPAGYLGYKEEMNLFLAFVCGVSGSLVGALFNYWIAYKMGRSFLLKYGKYVFFSEKSLKKMEVFFEKHGSFSTFIGRLLPAVRQYISFPAGLCKMSLLKFCLFTSLGAMIWVAILMWIGYSLGGVFVGLNLKEKNLFNGEVGEWINLQIHQWIFYIFALLILVVCLYLWRNKRIKK